MNFGEIIRTEILSRPVKDEHCKRAFLAGMLRGSGTLYEKDGELGLDFKVRDEETLNLLSAYFSQLYGYDIREVSVSEDRLNKKDRFVVSMCGGGVSYILCTDRQVTNVRFRPDAPYMSRRLYICV